MKPNPVGEPIANILDDQIQEVIDLWNESHIAPKWWQLWSKMKDGWFSAVRYIIAAGDYFVKTVDDLVEGGPAKKATVLASLAEVYDAIVPMLLPLFAKPFSNKIKNFTINIVASLLIDFIVNKYRKSEWKEPVEENAPTPEAAPTE